ncbi:MAG: L,D-transpeptidase [Prosthecobacter sp.]|uniref:L,D-transpeptidase n=1 Tax=Prosthecobacter sp. TaxID=1965333 RepID=UPI003902CAC8
MVSRFLLLAVLLSSCTTVQTTSTNAFRYGRKLVTSDIPQASRRMWGRVSSLFGPGDGSFWYADQMYGNPSIVINLGEQRVYLFKGGQLAGGSPISSGAEGYNTRPGSYHVMEKDIGHKSSIYGDYEDFQGNVIRQNIDNRVDSRPPGTRFEGAKMFYFMRVYGGVGMHQGFLPGYAASHGCIRLPGHMAEKFFQQVAVGTPVEIVP